jgi:hypothetical protein
MKTKILSCRSLSIVTNAHRLNAPSNDVHTNNGRKMRQDEGESRPFQWMLDNDNASGKKILQSIR